MDQHTGGKWFIHGTKRRKDNQLQSLEDTSIFHSRKLIQKCRLEDSGHFATILSFQYVFRDLYLAYHLCYPFTCCVIWRNISMISRPFISGFSQAGLEKWVPDSKFDDFSMIFFHGSKFQEFFIKSKDFPWSLNRSESHMILQEPWEPCICTLLSFLRNKN